MIENTDENMIFQSTPPRRGRLENDSKADWALHFNPRPRAGGDPLGGIIAPDESISIHAPAQGATLRACSSPFSRTISIHAPAQGATQAWKPSRTASTISIHAPAQGATQRPPASAAKRKPFQSTPPRRGRRCPCWWTKSRSLKFQSTPPRRGRQQENPTKFYRD